VVDAEYHRARRRRNRAAGLCWCGRAKAPGRQHCPDCRAAILGAQRLNPRRGPDRHAPGYYKLRHQVRALARAWHTTMQRAIADGAPLVLTNIAFWFLAMWMLGVGAPMPRRRFGFPPGLSPRDYHQRRNQVTAVTRDRARGVDAHVANALFWWRVFERTGEARYLEPPT
jgi:hypothetical protein